MDREEMKAKLLALRERETATGATGLPPGVHWPSPAVDLSPPGPMAVGEEMPDGRWRFPIRRTNIGEYETGPLPFANRFEEVQNEDGIMWAIVRKT